ncbi:RNA polymerase sigma factor [Bacillus litorisediminis]|uniref:RNA polymerase sigma factor n=1 Tax=Bacillus litorisediminis TaxID=2922713 RepID=UPI001FAC69C9|nr:RNA polymerase sigma factor [Bacillus litorisediminis]
MGTTKKQIVMEWYDLYYQDVYRFILFMIGEQQCCEDLVHDTFVRAYSAYDRFDHQSNVKTWLFSIAKHLVLDEIRKRQRRRLFLTSALVRDIPSSFDLEKYVENRDLVINLLNRIQRLKPHYRLVVTLLKIEECTTKEAADILNWSEVKVRKTLSRALRSLRKMDIRPGGEQIERLS